MKNIFSTPTSSAKKFFDWKEQTTQKLIKNLPNFITPNQLTTLRAILVIPVIFLLLNEKYIWAIVVFVPAYLLDLFDGPLARAKNQISLFGKLADPLADKILFLPVLIIIGPQFLPIYLIALIFALEISLISLAFLSLAAAKTLKVNLKPGANIFGKIKFALQTTGSVLLFFNLAYQPSYILTNVVFWAGVLCAVLSIARHITTFEKPV